MRFRRLELVRYGGFADRVFDFGELGEAPDLHLVVGPNEAGKSTALQAIGDFLFGIPDRTGQNWRYDYGQLRLRALIERGGELLDVTRRKGKRDTLLHPDGTPFRDDPIERLLGGVDRAAFERMFGLDHAKLRAGGEGILHNREDAARITLEAGTGVSNIGAELARLTKVAAELFKPGGQNPPVNRLMRERSDALTEVRQTSISDADWSQARQRRTSAEERRAALIDEAAALDREQARLDRVGRARGPLARLAQARQDREALGALPELPLDAAERLIAARAERNTATELERQFDSDHSRLGDDIASIVVPGQLLAERERIEALNERRPVVTKATEDLERRRAELERIDNRLDAARGEAGIKAGSKVPTAGWRKRAAAHLDERREARRSEEASRKDRARVTRELEKAERDLADCPETASSSELTAAIALLPTDEDAQLTAAQSLVDRKMQRAADLLSELTPWTGSVEALARLTPPTEADAAETRRALDAARSDAAAARKEAEAAETILIREQAKLERLAAGETLPTREAVSTARAERDRLLHDVRLRLQSARAADDGDAGAALAAATVSADLLVDRQQAEATRLAEYALAVAGAAEAGNLASAARERERALREQIGSLDEAWTARLTAIAFDRAILPADWPSWLTRRGAALEAERERRDAVAALDGLTTRFTRARQAIAAALAGAGSVELPTESPKLMGAAQDHAAALAQLSARRGTLEESLVSARETLTSQAEVDQELERRRTDLDADLGRLALEAGLPGQADETAFFDAVEALSLVAEDATAREGIVRQIEGIDRDRTAFDRDLAAVLDALKMPPSDRPFDLVRQLNLELRDAIRRDELLTSLAAERDRIADELARVRQRKANAGRVIDGLIEIAGVEAEPELDRIIAEGSKLAGLRAVEQGALDELAGADNGAGMEALVGEVEGCPSDEEAVARSRVEDRRREVAAEREDIGRALNAAEDEVRRASGESAAADAQQRAVDAGAALAQAAEEHVESAAAAALLRWVLDRHRASNQAPLIARAGALFAQVTRNAFSGLAVDYGEDDRAVIKAIRADGEPVGVEALSEGTRDQLYLALRLGSIEGRSAAGSLPIICDDLLITADDQRAASLLKVLAAAAAHTQVIVFSHHDHLVGLAREAVGSGLHIHRIEPVTIGRAA